MGLVCLITRRVGELARKMKLESVAAVGLTKQPLNQTFESNQTAMAQAEALAQAVANIRLHAPGAVGGRLPAIEDISARCRQAQTCEHRNATRLK